MASRSSTFGPRTTVCKQIGNLFLVPIPSRANPPVREIYNAQGKISAYEVQCRHSFTHNHWIPKRFVHLLFNFYVASVSSIRLQRSRKGRKSSGHDWRSITFPLPFIPRKSDPFVTRGAFNLPWQKNLVIKFYVLHMETVWTAWGLGPNGSANWLASWQWREKASQIRGNKGCFPKNCWPEEQSEVFPPSWEQTPAAEGMEEREEVGHLINIVFCFHGGIFAMIAWLYHTLAVGMNGYVYAKMLSVF